MKLKKVVVTVLSLIGVSLLAVACTPTTKKTHTTASSNQKMTNISVGTMPGPDSVPIYVAQEKGYFKKEGINTKIILFKDATKRDAAASAGQLNAAVVDLASFTAYMRNPQSKWKLITELTGSFGVALAKNSKIKSIKQLKGQKVANVPHSLTSYYMYKLLQKNGMKADAVKTEIVPQVPQRLEMLKNNQVAAAVLPQTFLTMAKVQGLPVLTQSGSSFQVTALAANGVLLKNKNLRQRFIKAYNMAVADINSHPSVLKEVLIKDIHLPKQAADLAPKQFPRYNQAKTVNEKTMQDVLKFAKEQGFFTKKVNPSKYIVPVN